MKQALETITYFLYLGALGFGGPFAIVAQMQRDLVEKKKWLTISEFRQALVVIKAMPGPLAHQMVVYMARRQGGRLVGALSGLAFLLPSYLMMIGLAYAYEQFQSNPIVTGFLTGVQMAAVAVIFTSLYGLTSSYWEEQRFWILTILGLLIAFVVDIPEPVLILLLGLWSLLFAERPSAKLHNAGALFWVCFTSGAFIFGTGYAVIPILQSEFVHVHNWVTLATFKDALAFGMLTPGPVLMTVTFLGYKMGGIAYATLATMAIFLPSFIHHLTWFPGMLNRLAKAKWLPVFLVGAIAGVTAMIIKSGLHMLDNITTFEAAVFIVSLMVLILNRYPTILIILLAGLVGVVPYLV